MDKLMWNIVETRIVNGKKTERVVNDCPLQVEVAVMALTIIINDIEGNDKVFGNYRTELVNEGTPQERHKFDWSSYADYFSVFDCIERDNDWGISMVENEDFELSYRFESVEVSEEETEFQHKRAGLCINTARCVEWAGTDEPLIQDMKSRDDFEKLGWIEGEYDKVMGEGLDTMITHMSRDFDGAYILGYSY